MQTVQNISDQQESASTLLNLENLIKNHVQKINELKVELKKVREMYNDSFNNDPLYQEANIKAKDVVKSKNAVKNSISKQPSVAALAQKVKDIRFDLKESQTTLSDLLCDYKEQTGATQLELFGGQIADIVQVAKLVRHK